MAGQQPARDGQVCLAAPGMGGLGRKIEALFWHFLCIASHAEVKIAAVGVIITTTVKVSVKWKNLSINHAFRRNMRLNTLYIGQYKDVSGIAEFSRIEQTINKWNYATAAI
jgi:hypothetical protein